MEYFRGNLAQVLHATQHDNAVALYYGKSSIAGRATRAELQVLYLHSHS